MTIERLSGTSLYVCAEREALWRIPNQSAAHTVIVCRVRCDKKGRISSYGMSKPCAHCMVALAFYDVRTVWYSTLGGDYCWTKEDLTVMSDTDYLTATSTILRFDDNREQHRALAREFIRTLPTWPIMSVT
jgi:hypothetical protein